MKRVPRCRILSFLVCTTLALAVGAPAQGKKQITVDSIVSGELFFPMVLPSYAWLRDGSALIYDYRKPGDSATIERLDPKTGKREPAVDANKALGSLRAITNEANMPRSLGWPDDLEGSGRYAMYLFDGDIYLLEFASSQFCRVTKTDQQEKAVSFSNDGEKLAYVRDNDLYVFDIEARTERRLTRDGSDTTLNGTLSWLYWEEIFGRRDTGYWWSTDSKSIAFLQTDESKVNLIDFDAFHPGSLKQRYPRAGQTNPSVSLGILGVSGGKIAWTDLSNGSYEYIVRIGWLPDSGEVSIQTLNRAQDQLDLFFVDRTTGKARHILKETDDAWVNIYDAPYFLPHAKQFLWISERSGYAHLYRYTMDGTLMNQVTKGEWALRPSGAFGPLYEGTPLRAVDEKRGLVYFTAAEKSTVEKHLYRIEMGGGNLQRLSHDDGFHSVTFNPDARYYFDEHSNISTLPSLSLHQLDGKGIQVLAPPLTEALAQYDIQFPSLTTIPAADGFALPAQILRPRDFEAKKRYPVVIYVYGGPSAPSVANNWNFLNYFDQILLSKGYLVVSVDNRSSAAISKSLEKRIKGQVFGEVELSDLLSAVKWLKAQPYVDSDRVGVWGWSAGGTYALLAMTHSKEFKAGIAIGPVTDWKYYDTKWSEFAMKQPKVNPEGYQKSSLVRAARNLQGRLLLVHGSYDNNVHIQNTWAFANELIDAGKLFDMMVYPSRQHGISDRAARNHLLKAMIEFWTRNL